MILRVNLKLKEEIVDMPSLDLKRSIPTHTEFWLTIAETSDKKEIKISTYQLHGVYKYKSYSNFALKIPREKIPEIIEQLNKFI